jgi:uncharacterized protein involved in outer membrane biogenesis
VSRPLKIVLIVVAVFVVIGLAVPYLVDVDRYRPRIVAEVESRTGHKLEIGKIRARLIPSVGFTLEEVTLGPPKGFADVNLLTAETIKGSVALAPLLHGDVEVSSVTIVKPRVTLATDERGRANYDFSTPGPAVQKSAKTPAGSSSSAGIALDSVTIRGAELSLVDVRGRRALPPSVKLSGLDVDLSSLDFSPGGMKNWKGSASLSGVKLEMAGMPPISFRSGDLKLENGGASGKCEADLGDVARVKGDISMPDFEKGVLNFNLATPMLDLDRLIAAAPSGKSSGAGGDPPPGPSAAGMNELVAKGKIRADKLRWAPYEASGATADVRVYGDRVEMPVTMSLYGGSLGITARLDRAPGQRFSANIQASQIDMEKLLSSDPSTRGKMTGHGELKLQVFGALGASLMNSLTGQGSFALRDGTLPGVQLSRALQDLMKVQNLLSFGQSGGGGGSQTTFSSIQGDLAIRSARLYTERTHADTNLGSGDIRGSIGFDQTLDLSGTWLVNSGALSGAGAGPQPAAGGNPAQQILGGLLGQATSRATGGPLSVPFIVRGTLKDPKVTPGGVPTRVGGTQQQSTTQQQQQKKKSILDIFGKP